MFDTEARLQGVTTVAGYLLGAGTAAYVHPAVNHAVLWGTL